MNYLTEDRRHALCAEYVVGTLDGPARRRFQGLLMVHPELRQTLWQWEKHVNALGGALPGEPPHPRVWANIQRRLGFDAGDKADNVVALRSKPEQATGNRWRWIAGFASAAALVLAVLAVWPQVVIEPEPYQVAIVQSDQAEPLWLIELRDKVLSVRATQELEPQADKDYELWLVAADGRAPISLGLLPKRGRVELERIALMDKVDIAALAVSLEPLGGSPTGSPTEVLYSAEPVAL
jgi:anti-sigma-K factor RskA